MNKTASFYLRIIFFTVILFMLIGCDAMQLVVNPTPQLHTATRLPPLTTSATPPPSPTGTILPYVHHIPSELSAISLEFDYPSWWFFVEDKLRNIIAMGDPRLLAVPTRVADEPHGTPSDFGTVDIFIDPVEPGQSLAEIVEPFKQGHINATRITLLNNYESVIDGYDAIVLEFQEEPLDVYSSLMLVRDIFFKVEGSLYHISFVVAEKDRGGDFEQGFEYFFISIKIAP